MKRILSLDRRECDVSLDASFGSSRISCPRLDKQCGKVRGHDKFPEAGLSSSMGFIFALSLFIGLYLRTSYSADRMNPRKLQEGELSGSMSSLLVLLVLVSMVLSSLWIARCIVFLD